MRLDHLLSRETRHPALVTELLRGTDFRSSLPGFQITALFSLFLELGTGTSLAGTPAGLDSSHKGQARTKASALGPVRGRAVGALRVSTGSISSATLQRVWACSSVG